MGSQNDQIAIKVSGVSKNFKLPHETSGSLKRSFTNLFRKKQRKTEIQHALKDISFEVKKGEFFGILGRNGSGKSTLLKILAEIYRPSSGSVHIDGKLVPFIELGVGFNPELTGRENVYLSAALSGFSRLEIDSMYDDIVQFAELEDFMDQKLKNYSSGMQVRLAFSVATRSKADILLIDEVLAVGDADFQRKCFDYFSQLKATSHTVVFVSHDMEAVRHYCDKAILIDKSKIIAQGEAKKVADSYSKLFLSNSSSQLSSNVTRVDGRDIKRETNGRATIRDIDVNVSEATIKVRYTIDLLNKEEIVSGLRVRSFDGQDILGTNNRHEDIPINNREEDTTTEICWTIPNILSEGRYLLDISVHDKSSTVVYDWWEGATVFAVNKIRRVPYTVDPEFKLEVS